MWNNIQASTNMGLQMLSTSTKRTREDCLNGEEDDDGPVPAKMGKTDDSLWEEYYPAGKCYQCNESNTFYNTPFACEQYSTAGNQCWAAAAQLPQPGTANVNVNANANANTNANANANASANANGNANLNQASSQCNVHLNNHLCNGGNAVANPSNLGSNHLSVSNGSIAAAAGASAFHHQQQTIRCDENGKSYLDLGSGSSSPTSSNSFTNGGSSNNSANNNNNVNNNNNNNNNNINNNSGSSSSSNSNSSSSSSSNSNSSRCCNPRTKWCMCGPACYRQRRLTVLNISMCKLGRYRQFTDPSLYRSVLICNTLRYIEREMEQEGCFASNQQIAPLIVLEPPPEPPRAPTPYPQTSPQEDNDSGIGDDNRSINWGSVLSLSSQSDLDPLNNNDSLGELDFSQDFEDIIPSCKLTPLSVDDILKTVPPMSSTTTTQSVKESPDIDNIMQVLRFT